MTIAYTRDEYLTSLRFVLQSYQAMVDRSFKARHSGDGTRKRIRAGFKRDVERYRFALGSLEAFESKDNVEDSFQALNEWQNAFEWKADKRWRRYFG